MFPDWLSLVTLFLAYALIILAFYIDFSKIRRERRAYQERMIALEEKQKKAERGGSLRAAAPGEEGLGQKRQPKPQGSGQVRRENAGGGGERGGSRKGGVEEGLVRGRASPFRRKEKAEKQAAKDAGEARKADAENEGE